MFGSALAMSCVWLFFGVAIAIRLGVGDINHFWVLVVYVFLFSLAWWVGLKLFPADFKSRSH